MASKQPPSPLEEQPIDSSSFYSSEYESESEEKKFSNGEQEEEEENISDGEQEENAGSDSEQPDNLADSYVISKRPLDIDGAEKDLQKRKKKVEKLFRVDDEIRILKGYLNIKKKKSCDLSSNEFHDFVKNSLKIKVDHNQLRKKVAKIKWKYMSNVKKAKPDQDPHFSKPNKAEMHQLCKKIWGDESVEEQNDVAVDLGNKDKSNQEGSSEYPFLFESMLSIPSNGLELIRAKKGLAVLDPSVAKKFEQRWKKLLNEQHLERLELIEVQTKLIMDALNARGS